MAKTEPGNGWATRFPALRYLKLSRRRKIPFVQQTAAADCGAAALTMVLAYHGKELRLDEVRETSGVSRFGLDAATILQTARFFGLRGRGIRVPEIEDLHYLEPGTILHWRFRHFVVFESIGRRYVRIVDPSGGRRRIPKSAVGQNFTGVALTFEPGKDFTQQKGHSSGFWLYLRRLFAQSDLVSRILTTTLFIQILALAVPLLTGVLVDRIVPRGDLHLLTVLAAGFFGLVLFQMLSALIRAFLLLHLRTRLDTYMTLEFLEHLVGLPYAFFQQRSTGDLLMRLNSNVTIREILTSSGLTGVLDGIMVSFYLLLLLVAHPQMGLLVAGLGLIRIALFLLTRKKQRDLMSESLEAQAESRNYQIQLLDGIETLKVCGAEHRSVEHWSNLFVRELNINLARGRLDAMVNSVLESLATASPLIILIFGGLEVVRGDLTLGMMLALNALALGFLTPLSTLVTTLFRLQLLGSYLDRIDDVLQAPLEQSENDKKHRGRLPGLRGRLVLEDVTFSYSPMLPPAVRDVRLEVRPGQFIAIVGGSGSGKSTLASLMAGLYDPQSGRVLFDQVSVAELELPWLRSQLGFVPQQPYIFGVTIRENIALIEPGLPFRRIVEAARQAAIHDEIFAMPMRYETPLFDRGASLSGGQRQRIALARALAHRPKILIMDEATSALDAVTERQVQKNLEALRCTRIVIAHRLSTVRDADLILVMDQGRIVERGTHDELLAQDGIYRALVAAQIEMNKGTAEPVLRQNGIRPASRSQVD